MNAHNKKHFRWVHEPKAKENEVEFVEKMYEVHNLVNDDVDERGNVRKYLNDKPKVRKF